MTKNVGTVIVGLLRKVLVAACGSVRVEFDFGCSAESEATTEHQATVSGASSAQREGNLVVRGTEYQVAIVFAETEVDAHVDGATERDIYSTGGTGCCDCCEARACNQKLFHFLTPQKFDLRHGVEERLWPQQ